MDSTEKERARICAIVLAKHEAIKQAKIDKDLLNNSKPAPIKKATARQLSLANTPKLL